MLLLSFRLKRCANATRFKLEAPYLPQLEQICKIVESEPAALPAARTAPLHSACFPSAGISPSERHQCKTALCVSTYSLNLSRIILVRCLKLNR